MAFPVDPADNLVLRHLTEMRSAIDSRLDEITLRISAVEGHLATSHAALADLHADNAAIHRRLDNQNQRLARIERRLELSDADDPNPAAETPHPA